MLDILINNMKKNSLLRDEYPINDLLDTIKNHIEENKDLLIESYKHEYDEDIDINRIVSSFNLIKDNKYGVNGKPFKNEYGLVSINYVPYGVVGLIIKKDLSIYNLASIISVIIQSNNSVIIEPYRKMGTLNILLLLVSQVISQVSGINEIVINDTNELLQNNNSLDLLVFIGDKNDYNRITSIPPRKYYGIANYELIVDKEIDKKLINEAKNQGIRIINLSNNDSFYDDFNYISSNYCVSLMSNNKEEIRKFISSVKSSFVLVNIIPTLETRINIDINDLLYKKETIIFEEK